MPRKSQVSNSRSQKAATLQKASAKSHKEFKVELLNSAQKMTWAAFEQHDIIILLGPAGTGKSFLTTAFAIKSILSKTQEKIYLTRPVVEAGESLGFLPGDANAKLNPYIAPVIDCVNKLVGFEGPMKDRITNAIEIAPLAYLRGRTLNNSICILDEAQNATISQLKLYLTRFGEGSKMILNGDPRQSDIGARSALQSVSEKLRDIPGIAVIEFKNNSIVRHPMIGAILDKLDEPSKENNA